MKEQKARKNSTSLQKQTLFLQVEMNNERSRLTFNMYHSFTCNLVNDQTFCFADFFLKMSNRREELLNTVTKIAAFVCHAILLFALNYPILSPALTAPYGWSKAILSKPSEVVVHSEGHHSAKKHSS